MRMAILTGALLLTACSLTDSGLSELAPVLDADGMMLQGTADYDWSLESVDGQRTSLAAYSGEVLFINIWASWCAPCKAELPGIMALRDSLEDTDIRFLAVSPEDRTAVSRFLRSHRFDLPFFVERTEMPASFRLRGLPTTYVVDRKGRIVLRHQGAADWDQPAIKAFLQRLDEEGATPPPPLPGSPEAGFNP